MPNADVTTLHLRRAREGNSEALGWIVERFTPLLVAQARYRLGPLLSREADPEDVVGEVWAVALPRLSALGEQDGRHTPVLLRFLSSAVLNKVNNLLTRTLRRGGGEGGPEFDPDRLPASVTEALSRVARDERAALLLERIEALEQRDREVLLLRAIEQRPNGEVAELLQLDPNTCAARYSRALKRLRDAVPGSLLEELES